MKGELRHVGIVVNNLEKCGSFWQDVFDFEIAVQAIECPTFMSKLLSEKKRSKVLNNKVKK